MEHLQAAPANRRLKLGWQIARIPRTDRSVRRRA
jgi:hypothetical protein